MLSKNARACFDDPGDEIVISGISGRFPNSNNVKEFAENLYNKIDCVDDDESRWIHLNSEVPKRSGKVRNIHKFDAAFFGYSDRFVKSMDPQMKYLLEHTYEALIDAGISSKTIRGSKTGVFIGCCYNEFERGITEENTDGKDDVGISGNARCLLANRISSYFDLHGPSFTIDTACSSSMYAIDMAYNAFRNGECDAAIVCGTNFLLYPQISLQFARLGVLASDGIARPFDADACGYTRSDAIAVVILQRVKDAKRSYANLVYSKTNCDGFKEEGIHYPSGKLQKKLMEEFYKDLNIDPAEVGYCEAHSTGTAAGDPEECGAIDAVFNQNRQGPLLIGSVKSNMGHSEASAGLCSVTKTILSFENELIPPNINFKSPRPDIPALIEGRLKVVNEPTTYKEKLIGVNSFGFGGANSHALFSRNEKQKVNRGIPLDNLPRLVAWSGRTGESINSIIDLVTSQPLDAELVALLQSSQTETLPANIQRGYGIFTQNGLENNAECVGKESQHFDGIKKPVVWVYSGIGSQWCGMGKDLMKLPIFAESIEKCHQILATKGLNLKEIITSDDPTIFDNVLHSFVGIAAIQIGLTDVMKALGLEPDYIIGHSVGELGCAYADSCMTAEEMILSSYSRGMACIETKTIFGSMAAVGLGYQKIKTMVPEGIDIACHNSSGSSTISGPADLVASFVEDLKSKDIFAKEVPCSNIPFHSSYIRKVGESLRKKLEIVIKESRERSAKWISSSVPEERWNAAGSKFSSPEYHTNNLLSSVLFEEASQKLPKNALMIEIAPHGLLQAIIRRSFSDGVSVSLTNKTSPSNEIVIMSALGKIFMNGFDIDVSKLYPEVEFPVSRGTPMISPYIKWNHEVDRPIVGLKSTVRVTEKRFNIDLNDTNWKYIAGHCIDGHILFPASGYLVLAWEVLGLYHRTDYKKIAVEFEDVKLLRSTKLTKDSAVNFHVMYQPGMNRFEISENGSLCVAGIMRKLENVDSDLELDDTPQADQCLLSKKDFYKELRLHGYQYSGLFAAVVEARNDGCYGKIEWNSNWVAFIDGLLQINTIKFDSRSLWLPTSFQSLIINPVKHDEILKQIESDEKTFEVFGNENLKRIGTKSIKMRDVKDTIANRRKHPGNLVLESYQFTHFHLKNPIKLDVASRIIMQLALENYPCSNLSIIEVDDPTRDELLLPSIETALRDIPLVTAELYCISTRTMDMENSIIVESSSLASKSDCYMIIASNCFRNMDFLTETMSSYKEKGFLICRENKLDGSSYVIPDQYQIIQSITLDDEVLIVLRYSKENDKRNFKVIKVSQKDQSYEWLEKCKKSLKTDRLLLFSENEPTSGLIGFVNCLRRELGDGSATCIFIDDQNALKFDETNLFYEKQIQLNLAINVLRDGQWGSYRHLLLPTNETTAERVENHYYVNNLMRGSLTALQWVEGPLNYIKQYDGEIVNVQYAALNFKDVMLATGKLSPKMFCDTRLEEESVLGFEFAGVTNLGRRVIGISNGSSISTKVMSEKEFLIQIPDDWTLQDASTVFVVYATVYTSFFINIRIKEGKKVLIHAGTGGVGLAAIRVALAYGLEVFTTVSTEEKKQYLLSEFPQLKEENIGNSRDTSFEKMIMMITDGKGVDYVLNSLADEKLQASIRCLGRRGHFLEIGKYDIEKDSKIGLYNFKKELTFHTIMLDQLFKEGGDQEVKIKLKEMIERDIKCGIIKPLRAHVFEANQVEQAFRFLASGIHMGKVVIKIRENENDKFSVPISVVPRFHCDPNSTYIVAGGLGGCGLELADWLILRGCRKLVLSSKRGIATHYQTYRIKFWESYGVHVQVNTADITIRAGCEKLIRDAMKLGPVGGIFNLAVQLRDSIFENQDVEKFIECMKPKADATKHLDELSRLLCPELQNFVVFSSVACGRRNAGQTNYGMANSVMERIIEQRHQLGLPAKAIQWGAIGDVGLIADTGENVVIGGTLQQRISKCLEVMDKLLTSNAPIVSSMVVAEKLAARTKDRSLFEKVMDIIGIKDLKSISYAARLSELGMDSLTAVEISQTLHQDFNLALFPEILRDLTVYKIMELSKQHESDAKFSTENLLEKSHVPIILPLNEHKSDVKYDCKCLNIPALPGFVTQEWFDLSKNLKFPSWILQLEVASYATSLDETMELVKEEILNLYESCDKFHLVAYSWGTVYATRIASMLESHGKRGHITYIDASPKTVKILAERLYGNRDNLELNDNIVKKVAENFGVNMDNNFDEIYQQEDSSMEAKAVKVFAINEEKENHYYKLQHVDPDKFMIALQNRVKMILSPDFKLDDVLKSTATLVKAPSPFYAEFEDDLDLKKHIQSKVEVITLEGDHFSMMKRPELIEILNNCHFKI